jgi:hypothetical protein
MKATSQDHYKVACAYLKALGVTPVYHRAPYTDGYDVGGPEQIFIDEDKKIHRFVFNSDNEIIHYDCYEGHRLPST